MLATRAEITRYIPQRDPMVMIHEIVQVTEEYAETQFEVLPDCIFVAEGFLREPGLVENIAQTAAAQIGYIYKKKGLPILVGYIASIRDLNVFSDAPLGAILHTRVEVTNQVLNVVLVEGIVSLNGAVICQCEMRIFVER